MREEEYYFIKVKGSWIIGVPVKLDYMIMGWKTIGNEKIINDIDEVGYKIELPKD